MNQYKDEYNSLIEHHVNRGEWCFHNLSFSCKKELVLAYMKTTNYNHEQDIVELIYEEIHIRLPQLLMRILENKDERLDPSTEMADEFVKVLIDNVSSYIDEDMEKMFDGNLHDEYKELKSVDYRQRAKDMNYAIKVGF
jgi:hypothetical protein